MEWLYHVDEDNKVIGRVSRDEAHERGILHRTGMVFLLDGDNIFLGHRAKTKKIYGDRLDTSSFHIEYGETKEEAAKREFKEEFGIDTGVEYVGRFHRYDPPENHIVEVFVTEYAGEDIVLDPTEFESGEFYSIEEADEKIKSEPITPWLRDAWPMLLKWMQR